MESELRKWDSRNKLLKEDNLEKEYIVTKLTKEVVDYQEQVKKLKLDASNIQMENNLNVSILKHEEKKFVNYTQENVFKKPEKVTKPYKTLVDNSESLKGEYPDILTPSPRKMEKEHGKEFNLTFVRK